VETIPTNSQVVGHTLESEMESAVTKIISYIGDDPSSEHCCETPKRVVKSWKELFSGYQRTAEDALGTVFKANGHNQIVILKDIEMYSTCSHHMIPFFGKVHIGYIPGEHIVGLSKLARLVEVFSRRLQVQERLTDQVADAIEEVLKPLGVMVVIEAKHLCMCARGIGKQNSVMVTSAFRGSFKNADARAEFMGLIS
jgi:GTP cyclohydrolase IA